MTSLPGFEHVELTKMSLPTNFHFSQASLADYVDCPRRFQLRYLLEQAWPAVESEPLLERERLAELGRRFHKLVQQHVEGLPPDILTPPSSEPELARWWQSYLASLTTTLRAEIATSDLPVDRRAEVVLSIPINTYRLTAHFDLIAATAERAVIVDWKTEQRQPTREQLLKRMQTRVYRYVLTAAQQRPPGTVSMIYWFAQYPDQPVALPYDAAQQADDHEFLTTLIEEIEQRARQDGAWEMTPHERKCAYCVYRSLCQRGVQAGTLTADEDDLDLVAQIKFEAVDAIEY
jgi:CRISPR/Cas system-associated exonuclease Cas4 (RecB family)